MISRIGVGVVGFGTVGRGVVKILLDNAGLIRRRVGVPIELVFVDEAGPTTKVVTDYRNLVQRQNVDLVIGFISSGNCLAVAPVAGHGECLAVVADPAHPPGRPGPGPGLDEEEALGAHQEMVHVEVGAGDVVEHPVPPVSQLIESVGDLPLTVEAQLEPLDRGSGSPHLDARPADRGERDGRQELRTRHRAQPSDPFPDGDQGEQCRRHHRLVGIALDDRSDRLVQ